MFATVKLGGMLACACLFYLFNKKKDVFKYLTILHRGTESLRVKKRVEEYIKTNLYLVHGKPSLLKVTDYRKVKGYLGNRIMVLKPPMGKNEKGLIFVMFSELFRLLPQAFDMEKLLNDYRLFLEPSWTGYCDEDILQYTRYRDDILIGSPEKNDLAFLKRIGTNLKPNSLGARDWVDHRNYERCSENHENKKFDIVFNAHWGWLKRHHVLFQTVSELPGKLRLALIGFPWHGRKIEDVIKLAKYYKIEDQVTIFENISYSDVVNTINLSKMGILLSLKEGSNRAIPECLFCNVPGIVLDANIGGVKNIINPETGLCVSEGNLGWAIEYILDNAKSFSPRKWALENISCPVTAAKLNADVRSLSLASGEDWTCDIVPKTNSPEPVYLFDKDKLRLNKYNSGLERYFKRHC